MNLQVHLIQRFVHPQDMGGGRLNQAVTMACQRAEHANLIRGSKRRPQQSHRMQVPQPLTIGNIGSPARNVLEMPRIDQAHLESTSFQDLEQRNPVDASGFHRHRFDPAALPA